MRAMMPGRIVTFLVGALVFVSGVSAQWDTVHHIRIRFFGSPSLREDKVFVNEESFGDLMETDPFDDLDRIVTSLFGAGFSSPPMLASHRSHGFLRQPLYSGPTTTLAALLRPRLGMLPPPPPRHQECPCRQDVENFCKAEVTPKSGGALDKAKGVAVGGSEVLKCLLRRKDELRPQCQQMLASAFVSRCHEDIGKLCSTTEPGDGRLAACLRNAPRDQLSAPCASLMEGDSEEKAKPITTAHMAPLPVAPTAARPSANLMQTHPHTADTTMGEPLPAMNEREDFVEVVAAPEAPRRSPVTIIVGSTLGALFVLGLVAAVVRVHRRSRPDYRPLGYVPMLT